MSFLNCLIVLNRVVVIKKVIEKINNKLIKNFRARRPIIYSANYLYEISERRPIVLTMLKRGYDINIYMISFISKLNLPPYFLFNHFIR